MKKTILFVALAALLCLAGCRWMGIRGNGHITTEERPVTDFSQIDSTGAFDIEWLAGSPSLSITVDENLLSLVETSVRDKTLHLHTRDRLLPTHRLKVKVTSNARTGSHLTGAAELKADNLSGASYAVQTSGAAEIKLSGSIDHLLADMTGASELQAKSLQTRTAEISTTGAGSAEVTVSENLKVIITGAGSVVYHGNPTVTKTVTGAGKIKRKD